MNVWLSREDIVSKRAKYERSIDPYTSYIEDYRQKKIADRCNKKMSNLICFCNDVLSAYDRLKNSLDTDNIEYCKGYFRVAQEEGYYLYYSCNVRYKKYDI